MEPIDERFIEYAEKFTESESKQIHELKKTTEAELEYSDMMSGRIVGSLLKLLIRLQKATSVLEVGAFVGYGTLNMAEALPDDGSITTIEYNERYIDIAKANFKKSPDRKKIRLLEGEAEVLLKRLEETFDLVFLDADKANYRTYIQQILPRLKPGGVLVIDNAYWKGGVWQADDEKSASIHATNQFVANHKQLEHLFLTVRDGLMIARKRP